MSAQIKVLVVDDSSLVRRIITDILESDPQIKVIGTADNGEAAVKMANKLDPDVITMDIEMPVMDGLTALKRIIATNPKPVIMMSVFTQHGAEETFKALEYGAVDFIPKPSSMLSPFGQRNGRTAPQARSNRFTGRRIASDEASLREKSRRWPPRGPAPSEEKAARSFDRKAPARGSWGSAPPPEGPPRSCRCFQSCRPNFPSSILVVQHMPEGFTKAFAERLDTMSSLNVKEAEDMDPVLPGCAFVAPGNLHISIEEKNNRRYVRVFKGEKVSGHRPSIDVLFHSMAATTGKNTVAVIMTGMGRDGADGITQDKGSRRPNDSAERRNVDRVTG